jgi:hypothetical protein
VILNRCSLSCFWFDDCPQTQVSTKKFTIAVDERTSQHDFIDIPLVIHDRPKRYTHHTQCRWYFWCIWITFAAHLNRLAAIHCNLHFAPRDLWGIGSGIGDLQPTRPHNLSFEQKQFECSSVGSKHATECTTLQFVWQCRFYANEMSNQTKFDKLR